jgi:uncharacterized BrkB/YihY/UPF0761 family membrane protein
VEALRVSLNRAYRVTETRAWYMTRAQSLRFRGRLQCMVIMAISFLLVLAPLVLRLARQFAPWMETLIIGSRQLAHSDRSDGPDHRFGDVPSCGFPTGGESSRT